MAGFKFLYVEDNVLFANGNVDRITDLGLDIEIVLVPDQERAQTALANQGPFDLIVSDLHCPDVNGGNDGGAHLYVARMRVGDMTPFAFHSSDSRRVRHHVEIIDPAVAEDMPDDMIFSKAVEFPSVVAAALKHSVPEIAQALTSPPRFRRPQPRG